jgi:flagellar biosynthesis protein FliQ
MNFHEKSAWACLVSILVVYTPYFWTVFQRPMATVGLFVTAVIILAVLLTGFHIANALAARSIRDTVTTPPHDELDRIIELKSAKLSGTVLAFIVIVWCISAVYTVLGVSGISHAETLDKPLTSLTLFVPAIIALTGIHALFAGFVIANITYYGSIVASYRRMARG